MYLCQSSFSGIPLIEKAWLLPVRDEHGVLIYVRSLNQDPIMFWIDYEDLISLALSGLEYREIRWWVYEQDCFLQKEARVCVSNVFVI